jgi:hypothetical protein
MLCWQNLPKIWWLLQLTVERLQWNQKDCLKESISWSNIYGSQVFRIIPLDRHLSWIYKSMSAGALDILIVVKITYMSQGFLREQHSNNDQQQMLRNSYLRQNQKQVVIEAATVQIDRTSLVALEVQKNSRPFLSSCSCKTLEWWVQQKYQSVQGAHDALMYISETDNTLVHVICFFQ